MTSFDRSTFRPDRIRASEGQGRPLDPTTRRLMERRFGDGLAQVPTRTGGYGAEVEADRIAQAVAYPAARPSMPGSVDFSRTRIHTSPGAAASTTSDDAVSSVIPYAKGSRVALATLFPDSLFGFAPNHISSWIHAFQDRQVTVTEATADVFRAHAPAPMRPRGPGEGGSGPQPRSSARAR